VEQRQVDDPRQQREELGRVVVEHADAARARPDDAGHDAEREQREADARGVRAYVVNGRQTWQAVKYRAELLQAKLALLPEEHHARREGDEERGVCENDQRRVDGKEPRRAPIRDATGDLVRVAAHEM
jgi:hypothetical protein